MSHALRRYALLQARVRAWIAELLTRRQLETLSGYPDARALEAELDALGWGERERAVDDAFRRILDALEGPARVLVALYRRRYAVEDLKVLLRAVEQGRSWEAIRRHLRPTLAEELGAEAEARALLEARTLAEAVDRLAPEPFGEALRRHVRAQGRAGVSRLHLEAVAERDIWEAAWSALDALPRSEGPGARRLLGAKLDAAKLVCALRLRPRGLVPEERLLLLPEGGAHLSGPRARAVLAREAPERWASAFARSPYAAALAEHAASPPALERRLDAEVSREARRALAATPFQVALPLGYLMLLELQAVEIERRVAARRFARRGASAAARAA